MSKVISFQPIPTIAQIFCDKAMPLCAVSAVSLALATRDPRSETAFLSATTSFILNKLRKTDGVLDRAVHASLQVVFDQIRNAPDGAEEFELIDARNKGLQKARLTLETVMKRGPSFAIPANDLVAARDVFSHVGHIAYRAATPETRQQWAKDVTGLLTRSLTAGSALHNDVTKTSEAFFDKLNEIIAAPATTGDNTGSLSRRWEENRDIFFQRMEDLKTEPLATVHTLHRDLNA